MYKSVVRCRRIDLLGDAACVLWLVPHLHVTLSHTGPLGAAADALSVSVGTFLVQACTHEALGQLEVLLHLRGALSVRTSDRLNARNMHGLYRLVSRSLPRSRCIHEARRRPLLCCVVAHLCV